MPAVVREIATVRAPRRLRAGSRRAGAGLGVVAGCARGKQSSVSGPQGPPRSSPRVNMHACDVSNVGDIFEI